MKFINSLSFALELDLKDPLSKFRNRFHFPEINNHQALYFCGNSLGLQPKSTEALLKQELDNWAQLAVEGHFRGKNPWLNYHRLLTEPMAKIVGALPQEVVVMNSLTANLHLMMVSFYRPTPKRYKIICEEKAFPSDQYALDSQVCFHGFKPDDAIIEVKPRAGEYCIRNEDVLNAIEQNADSLALVMMGGVNYYTGQVFDMQAITDAGHKAGAEVGFDLAHAAGNIRLQMHKWDVDFAVWCSYKYLNSGPGGVAGLFVHERHANNSTLPRFTGWWGNDVQTRFLMHKDFVLASGAEGWQLSNAPVLSMAALRASLALYDEAGMEALCRKSDLLTGFLEFLIDEINQRYPDCGIQIITPLNSAARGCQLSIFIKNNGRTIFDQLNSKGIITDWREPSIIRVAPVPLYNSFEEVYRFALILQQVSGFC